MRFMKGLSLRLCRGAMYVGHMVLMVCFEDGSYFPFCRDACFDFDAACQCIHRPPLFDLGLFFVFVLSILPLQLIRLLYFPVRSLLSFRFISRALQHPCDHLPIFPGLASRPPSSQTD